MGGAQYQVKLITEALVNHGGFDVYIIANKANPANDPNPGYALIKVGSRKGWRRFTYLFDAPELLAALDNIEPDIIYHRVSCSYTGICGYYARQSACKFVWHIAHEWDVSPFDWKFSKLLPFRLLEKKVAEFGIRRTHLVFAQTQIQQRLLKANFAKSSVLIPNFHPPADERPDKRDVVTILWVANLKAWKRPDAFVRLAKQLAKRPNVEFVMIGRAMFDRSGINPLQQDIDSIPNLTYLGEQPLAVVNEWLARAHIFVNTSVYEGFPNTFIQAWMRSAVVVSLSVNPDETLSAGKEREAVGFCADDNETSLAALVDILLLDTPYREQVALNALEHVNTHHSLKNVARVVAELEQLAANVQRSEIK